MPAQSKRKAQNRAAYVTTDPACLTIFQSSQPDTALTSFYILANELFGNEKSVMCETSKIK